MPCFKGLAVSIHTPDGPIGEHAIQKQTRASRISAYIPVPPAKVPPSSKSGKPEQSTFAISITLLTPGLTIPYSTPQPTNEDPYPRPRFVGGLPGSVPEDVGRGPLVHPYLPKTNNPNETIAAYIYFDGRAKEEVATLLRKGEETWVNSRWVSVPESEGGGLAEREFLFREVGLERWLNGLDLEGGKDKAERIERRQRRLEKKRQKKIKQEPNSDSEEDTKDVSARTRRNGVLRYGSDGGSLVEDAQDDGLFSSDSDSEDEPPQPEAAGQIKVALFRVLASGEIRRGEYSPQFDAHDDDDDMNANGAANGDGGDEDIDHTTSFAKPKQLDPKSISTQTVTGLDGPESPFAVFTFFYRGEKQLRKMGILESTATEKTPMNSKRKASGPDFSKLGPLKSTGTVGFSGYRDADSRRRKDKKSGDADAMDSDADDEDDERVTNGKEDGDEKQDNDKMLSPEDARRQGEIAEGVQKIKLKRQHSAEPLTESAVTRKSPYLKTDDSPSGTPQSVNSTQANAGTPPEGNSPAPPDSAIIGSPFKRARASLPGLDSGMLGPLGSNSNEIYPPTSFTSGPQDAQQPPPSTAAAPVKQENAEVKMEEEDEEL
ncbi:uncharacterized protein LTR77_005529 [Saxophila tyrrhenica]|uniref:DUF7918 domain-containing protein n=1 Tax=Saxophila tyrrhenica TaxID=1690608 RepID=A0AAV9P8W3_9PEZI|nr:hypothetical protein LTR77_005529 [Saxophila tyrrhenica]